MQNSSFLLTLWWIFRSAGTMLAVPFRRVVIYGTRFQLFHGPWSLLSRTTFNLPKFIISNTKIHDFKLKNPSYLMQIHDFSDTQGSRR